MTQDPRHKPQKQFHTLLEERLDHLAHQIEEWVDDAQSRGDTLKRLVTEARQQPFLLDGAPLTTEGGDEETAGPIGDLADFARDIENSADQGRILSRLISGAAALAPRVLLFIVKGDEVKGWAARGFHDGFDPRIVVTSLDDDSLVSEAFRSCSVIRLSGSERPGNTSLAEALGTPQQMLAVPMWVRDRVVAVLYADTTGASWYPDALSVMVSLASLSLEALPARTRYPRPAGEPAGTVDQVVPTETPDHGATVAMQPETRSQEPAAQSPPAIPLFGAVTPSIPSVPVEPVAPLTPITAVTTDEEETSQDTGLLEEARRFAQLLVSEIVLYNETAIEEGRRNKDLYNRLKDDIERSRRMYEQRMGPQLPDATAFFRDELVEKLANGDASAIILPWD